MMPRSSGGLKSRAALLAEASLKRVINATGVIIHTNLGRAPLARAAIDAISDVATHYSNLEYDLERGERGRRESHSQGLLARLAGSEDATVVNNNAAAVMLVLNTLAEGGEVIVSRGELIEIGGSFRIPDVMEKSGARLREVGTTNRTRISGLRARDKRQHAIDTARPPVELPHHRIYRAPLGSTRSPTSRAARAYLHSKIWGRAA